MVVVKYYSAVVVACVEQIVRRFQRKKKCQTLNWQGSQKRVAVALAELLNFLQWSPSCLLVWVQSIYDKRNGIASTNQIREQKGHHHHHHPHETKTH